MTTALIWSRKHSNNQISGRINKCHVFQLVNVPDTHSVHSNLVKNLLVQTHVLVNENFTEFAFSFLF